MDPGYLLLKESWSYTLYKEKNPLGNLKRDQEALLKICPN